jgi:hypothetical protein
MATRSFIARFNPETDMYESIYCHWDGYPQGVGVTLRDNYSYGDSPAVLISFGDISSLRDTLFETQKETYKLRGDSDVDAKIFRFMSEMIEYYRNMSCEYGYIFRDGKWTCYALDPQEIDLSTMESFTNV